jgi:AAA+ ATPase superfamily predicted ATPase
VAFYGRRRELALLDDLYRRPGGQMFILYGRRRVGKTTLLVHWVQTRGHRVLFWSADRVSAAAQIRSFSQAIQAYLNPSEPISPEFTYGSWELALQEMARIAEAHRLVVVLDEITYLFEADPSLSSILQRLWDHRLKQRNLFLCLTGSHAGMIEREVLAYRSPLYNRASASLHLQPLPFGALASFLPNYSAADRASVYACVGGVPQYLEALDRDLPVEANLKSLLSSNLIMDDAGALLRDQLGEPRFYISIIQAIAGGYRRSTEIATMAGVPQTNVAKYLGVLEHLGIITREVPATESRPERSKSGRYRICDHYLRFYYRFLAPSRGLLEQGRREQVWQNINKHLSEFVGEHIFEELSREWVLTQADAGRLPFVPRRVGSFWGAGKPQIDVVAINEDAHALILGECKWLAEPLGAGIVKGFLERATRVIPEPADRWSVTYAFFSRSGFTPPARQAARGQRCLWIDLDQIDALLKSS